MGVPATTDTTSKAFHPDLLIESVTELMNDKTLIHYNGEYLKWDPLLGLQAVSSTTPTVDLFIEHGMEDLSALDRKKTTITIPMDDNTSQGEALGEGRVFKEKINLKKYIDLISIDIISNE